MIFSVYVMYLCVCVCLSKHIYIYTHTPWAYVYATNDVLIFSKDFETDDWQAKTNIIYPEWF